jgi:hypothetical protein
MSDHLGHLIAYTISTGSDEPNLDVTRDQLEAWFDELGISTQFLPGATRTVDAFRQATSGVVEEYTNEEGQKFRLVVEEMRNEPNLVVRWVMRQGLSVGTKSIKVAELKFYRPRRTPGGRVAGSEDVKSLIHRGLGGRDLEVTQAFVDGCLARYSKIRRQLGPDRVRKIIRDTLARKGAIPVQPTNTLYFVPPDAYPVALAVREFVQRCGGKCKMLLVPVVDDEDQREMLREAIDSEVDTRAHGTLEAMAKWQADNPLKTPGRLLMHGWLLEYRGLTAMLERYGDQYEMTFPLAAQSLENLQVAMDQLSQRFMAQMRS